MFFENNVFGQSGKNAICFQIHYSDIFMKNNLLYGQTFFYKKKPHRNLPKYRNYVAYFSGVDGQKKNYWKIILFDILLLITNKNELFSWITYVKLS